MADREYLSNATRSFRRNIDVQLQISKLEHLGTQHQSSCIVKYITFRKSIRVRPIIRPNTVKTKTGCRLLQIRWCLRYSSQIPQLCSAISSRQPDLRELYFATLSVTSLDLYLSNAPRSTYLAGFGHFSRGPMMAKKLDFARWRAA